MKDPLWDVISQEIQTKEYIDGRNARFNGFKKEDNPYVDLAYVEEYLEQNSTGENLKKCDDWRFGWYASDALLNKNAEMFEKMKNSTPLPEDEFVEELEALLTKYNFRIIGVNNDYDYLYFKSGSHKRYDFAAPNDDGSFTAARPIGG